MMTASERQRAIDMLDSLDKATQRRVLASVSSFAEWLYHSAYSIYVKVKDAIYGIWESMVCAIGDAINAVGEAAICLAKRVSETETAREIGRTEFGRAVARTEFAQAITHLWKKRDCDW